MTEKRFSKFELTQLDDATINYGVKDSITGKWHQTVNNQTARELTDLLNKQDKIIKKLTNFKNKVFSILDEEIQYKKGLQELSKEKSMDMSLEKFTFELAMLMTIKRKLEGRE